MPEVEPASVLFNRLWPLAVLAVVSGAVGFFIPQVPAIATGYALLVALTWRKQSAAVAAIEDRDGVRFYFDRSSPFGPPQLLDLSAATLLRQTALHGTPTRSRCSTLRRRGRDRGSQDIPKPPERVVTNECSSSPSSAFS